MSVTAPFRVNMMLALLALLMAMMMYAVPALAQVATPVPPISAAPPPPAAGMPPIGQPGMGTPVPQAPGPLTLNDGYVIGTGDVLEVAVLGIESYRARAQVQIDGTVQLPLINNVAAVDRTVLQLRDDIRAALVNGGFFTNPVVAVAVASFTSRTVTVLGEVATPTVVPIDRNYRVSEILARVGGPRASAADVLTLTRVDGTSQEIVIADAARGAPDADPVVNPGDRIYIAIAPQFFIDGEINSPGSYRIDRRMTIRMAIARGGGLTPQASRSRISVFRNGEELRSFDINGLVQPNDTIVIGERFF